MIGSGRRAIAAAALLAIIGSAAPAQTVSCYPRDELGRQLANQYGEALTAQLLAANENAIFEVFAGAGSWTLIITDLAGNACVIGVGTKWKITGIPQGEPG